jgi:hypothetical protein
MNPKNKFNLTVDAIKGLDSRVDSILENPDGVLGLQFKEAKAAYNNPLKKRYIEASLICSQDFEKIAEVLEVDLEVLKVYSEFFFSITSWDRLTKIDHIDRVSEVDLAEGSLKRWALNHGLDFISWRLGKTAEISPVTGLQDLFNICLFKSKEAMYNSSTSETGKESVKWVKLSTDISRLLKLWVMDSNAARKDLEIAIREVLPEFDGLDSILEENLGNDN